MTDNGLQDLKQQFRVFKNNDLLTAFELSTDPEAELKYHWNSENVEGDYHMSLLPVFPPVRKHQFFSLTCLGLGPNIVLSARVYVSP